MLNIDKFAVVVLCALIVGSLGCGQKQPAAAPKGEANANEGPVLTPPKQEPAPATPKKDDHAALPVEGEKGEKPAANEEVAKAAKIKANLASLSAADRALAEKQKICPVSGELLGAMDPPKKVSVAGHEVFICCPGCEEDLRKDPAKYLAKIGLEPAKR